MKIVCESCGAKYSIADEKVAGKVFKIRCKRCSEVIVVRGDQDSGGEVSDAPAGGPTAVDAIWHVVVDGDQQGPMAVSQLTEMLSAGAIDWETFVWAEGFDNWLPLREVEDLVAQISGEGDAAGAVQEQTTTAAGGFGAAAPEAFAGQASMGADPFADDSSAAAPVPAVADSPLTGGGAAASPRVSEEQAMTGARNENSVLFSLKNLQALATGSNTPSISPSSTASVRPSPGFATGEGSGLIDIRALASATGTSGATQSPADDEKDELLSLGGQAGGLGALASPMMAPNTDDNGSNKMVLVAGILGGAFLLAAGVIAFAVTQNNDPQPAAAVAPIAPAAVPAAPAAAVASAVGVATPAVGTTAPTPATPPPSAPPATPSEGELAAQAAASAGAASTTTAAKTSRRKARRARASRQTAAAAGPAPVAKKPSAPKARRGKSSIDDLLSNALGGGGRAQAKKATPKPAANSNLPEKPGRNDVMAAMGKVKSAVAACGKGASGVAFANITVKGSTGRITNAVIQGQTGKVGSCIAKAVRKARFPKFKAKTFKVKFPFRL